MMVFEWCGVSHHHFSHTKHLFHTSFSDGVAAVVAQGWCSFQLDLRFERGEYWPALVVV